MATTAWAFASAALVSELARRAHALSPSGAIAATIVGGLTVAGTGFQGGVTLATFFASASLLGRLPRTHSLSRFQRRGNERDVVQVLANGGACALCATASAFAPARVRPLLWVAFGGAVAAATADTWATEIGTRARRQPVSIVTLRPVPSGASGGVTLAGTAAAVAGAATIAFVATLGPPNDRQRTARMLAMLVAGFTGAVVDSVLGATLQDVRFCDTCRQETELHRHDCGRPTRTIRGRSWCDNDTVNAIATMLGAAVAMTAAALLTNLPNQRDDQRDRDCARLQ